MNAKLETQFLDLISTPLTPDEFPNGELFEWLLKPRLPVLFSEHPIALQLIRASLKGNSVRFIYMGGSTAGRTRKVSPAFLFTFEDDQSIYIYGFCHERQANRIFRVDRIVSEHVLN
jgi:hypothetical protein